MCKKLLTSIMLMVFVTVNAQNFTIVENSFSKLSIEFNTPKVHTVPAKNGMEQYTLLSMEGYTPASEVGAPALPELTKLIEIPLCDDILVEILSADYEEYDASQLGIQGQVMPTQRSYPKSYTGERPFEKNALIYGTNSFYTSQPEVITVHKLGIMRDVNIANIVVSPVSYNPVSNKVRIYKHIEVALTYENANIPATLEMKDKYYSPMFHVAKDAVINPMEVRNEFNSAPIKYLIIANSMFAENDYLNEFINWKKRIGYIVEVAYTGTIGTTTTDIKNFIMTKYTGATAEDPAPTFVLFIGDVAQIPAFSGTTDSHKTDLYYATWTTGDNLPDCFYGRFSAQTVNQLNPQFEKTLMYEQYTMPDPSYLGTAVLIAGTDSYWSPTHADGQINYIFNNYVTPNSTTHHYNTVYKHSYDCSSEAAIIRNEIGAGCGWANYTAHGSEEGWANPAFNVSQVASMNNTDKYGFLIGNCCLSCKFDVSECFGEALLRADKKGAVGYIGGSNNTLWNEDFYWAVGVRSNITANSTYSANNLGAYDKIFHTHGENHDVWATTISAMMQCGNMAVEASSSSSKLYYWEIYHLMGDPSLKPYLGIPNTMTVNSADAIVVGSTSFDVNCAPYAYVALTYNNELIGATFADANGNATITFPPITIPGAYELAVSGQNYIQYFKNIMAIAPTGSYVMCSSSELSENSIPGPGATINIDVTLKNYGVATSSNITATLTCSTPGVTIIQGTITEGPLAADASVAHNNAFTVVLPANMSDGNLVNFTISTTSDSVTTDKNFQITIVAPLIRIENTAVTGNNGSPSFAPGDIANVTVNYANVGHATLSNASLHLTSHYSLVTVLTPAETITNMEAGTTASKQFQVSISPSVPDLTVVPLYVKCVVNNIVTTDTIFITVGNAMETFESGDLSTFSWQSNNNPWFVTTSGPYSGTYCAQSKQNLSNNAQSDLYITLTSVNDGNISYFRKVSSENGYDFFKFLIDNVEMDSQSGTVNWSQASYPVTAGTHTYRFRYTKDYSASSGSDCAWIDNIIFPGMGTMCVEDTQDNVGMDDFSTLTTSIYPNPTSGMLHIACSEPVQEVVIYDLSGRQISQQHASGDSQVSLNVHNLTDGIYFVRIITANNNTSISKFIKQ